MHMHLGAKRITTTKTASILLVLLVFLQGKKQTKSQNITDNQKIALNRAYFQKWSKKT